MGRCRREILAPVIGLNDQHLRRLIYERRIHDSMEKDPPNRRPVELNPVASATLIFNTRRGGLYHRYQCREAASRQPNHLTVITIVGITGDTRPRLAEDGPQSIEARICPHRFNERP